MTYSPTSSIYNTPPEDVRRSAAQQPSYHDDMFASNVSDPSVDTVSHETDPTSQSQDSITDTSHKHKGVRLKKKRKVKPAKPRSSQMSASLENLGTSQDHDTDRASSALHIREQPPQPPPRSASIEVMDKLRHRLNGNHCIAP